MRVLAYNQELRFANCQYFWPKNLFCGSATITPMFEACDKSGDARESVMDLQEHFCNRSFEISLGTLYDEDDEQYMQGLLKNIQGIYVHGPFLKELKALFGKDLRVKVKCGGWRWPLEEKSKPKSSFFTVFLGCILKDCADGNEDEAVEEQAHEGEASKWETKGMKVESGISKDEDIIYYCEQRISPTIEWYQVMHARPKTSESFEVYLMITIELSLTNFGLIEPKFNPSQALRINRKLLEEKVEADVILVAQCGTEIKCHKSFLAAHSEVLAAMFGPGFKESKTSTVQMVDMTKEGIKAFLEYIYCWEIGDARKSPRIALELFEAAHKYNVKSLENTVKKILMRKPNSWYDVSTSLKLFAFARNVDGCGDLKTKCVEVLKSMPNDELRASEEYDRLFTTDVNAAKELCAVSFSV